jgi:hypothetical protein
MPKQSKNNAKVSRPNHHQFEAIKQANDLNLNMLQARTHDNTKQSPLPFTQLIEITTNLNEIGGKIWWWWK